MARPGDDGLAFVAINDHHRARLLALRGPSHLAGAFRGAVRYDATTATAVTATAVTGGAPAREPADEDARPAAAADGREPAPMRVLRRGAGSRRSALAASADHHWDPVPHHLRDPVVDRDPARGRAQTSTAQEAEAPTRTRTTPAPLRVAHQAARGSRQDLEATSRSRPRRTEARTGTADAADKQERHRASLETRH